MKHSEDLLEEILFYTHCNYLSDLYLTNYFSEIIEAIKKIDIENYPLDEWNEAVQYIAKQKVDIKDKEDAKRFLNEYLNRCSE